MQENTLPHKRCRFCGYEWIPRVARPKACPCCTRRNFEQLEEEMVFPGKGKQAPTSTLLPRSPAPHPEEAMPGE